MNNIDFKNKYLKYKIKYLELRSLTKFGELPSEAEIQGSEYFESCNDVIEFYEKSVEHKILILSHIDTIGVNLGIFGENEFEYNREESLFQNKITGKSYDPNNLYNEFEKRCKPELMAPDYELPSEDEIQEPGYFKSCNDVIEFYDKSVKHQNLILSHIKTIGENLDIFKKSEFQIERDRKEIRRGRIYKNSEGVHLNPMELYDEFVKRCSEKGE